MAARENLKWENIHKVAYLILILHLHIDSDDGHCSLSILLSDQKEWMREGMHAYGIAYMHASIFGV